MADPWAAFPDAPADPAADPWAAFPDMGQAPPAASPDVGQAPPQAPPAAPSMWTDILASIGGGMTEGAANVLGFLPDMGIHAVNNLPRLANILPGVEGVGPMTDDPVTVSGLIKGTARTGAGVAVAPVLQGVDALFGTNEASALEAGVGGLPTVPEYDPQTRAGKFAGRVAEELGAAAVPVIGAIGQAGRMGKPAISAMANFSARQPSTYLPSLAKSFLAPAVASPGRYAAQEFGISTGAGMGAAALNSIFDNEDRQNPWIDAAGALLGAGSVGVASAVLPRLGDIYAAATGNPRYASGVVKEGVAAKIASNSDVVARRLDPNNLSAPMDTDPLVQALRRTTDIETVAPGYKPTTAEVAGDLGLLNLETARSGADNATLFKTRQGGNVDAIEEALRPSAPTEPSSRFTQDLATARTQRLTDADLAATIAARDADAVAAPFAVNTTRPERGGAIREGIETAAEAARARTDASYWAADIGRIQADPTEAVRRIDDAVAGLTEVRKGLLPDAVIERVRRLGAADGGATQTGLLDAAGNPIMRPASAPAPIDIDELADLTSELGRLQRNAVSSPRAENGGRNAAEAIGRVRSAVDGYLSEVLTPEQKALLDAAKQAKFDEVEAFGRQGDPLAAATARYPGGTPKMRDDRVASTFTDPQNIDRLFAQAPTDSVRRAVKEEILSRGDFTTAEGAAAFRQQYADQLKRFPGLADEVEKVAQARGAAETSRAGASTLAKEIGPEGAGTVAKYLRYGDERAERAMERVVASPRPAEQVDELLRFVGDDPASVQGARKAFWEVMEKKGRSKDMSRVSPSGNLPWDTGKWKAFMDDAGYQAAAERLYRDNPEHWENVKQIEAALRQLGQGRASVKAANPSGTFTSQKGSAVSLAEVQAKYYEVARGRVNPLYMLTYLGTRIANRAVGKQSEAAFKQLLDKALLEPDVARTLLTEYNPANRAALRRYAKSWIGNTGANLLDSAMEDEDPVLDAVEGR